MDREEEGPAGAIILRKKRKHGGPPKIKAVTPFLPHQSESIQESMEKFFLSKDTKKSEIFEKESLDNDFLIVKPCDKKPGKVVHKGRPQLTKKPTPTETESKVLLSDLLGLQPKVAPKKEEQKEKTPDVWNYLDQA